MVAVMAVLGGFVQSYCRTHRKTHPEKQLTNAYNHNKSVKDANSALFYYSYISARGPYEGECCTQTHRIIDVFLAAEKKAHFNVPRRQH